MSAENGFGTGGQLYIAEEEAPVGKPSRIQAVGAAVSAVLKAPKVPRFQPDWRGIVSTAGELAAILLISVGCGWYSLGAGFIGGGVGLLAWSVAAGAPGPGFREKPPGKPEKNR